MMEFEDYKTRKSVRFMEYQLMRLQKLARIQSPNYWMIVASLLRRSASFRASAIHHVFPNWYKKNSYYFILGVNRKVDRIIKTMDTKLEFVRVYIDKGDGSKRPLGVPSPSWRLLLHMYNNFIHLYMADHVLPSQHGFIPGRGTLTAWKYMFENDLLDRKWIYECDLRNFFNEVSQMMVFNPMKRAGVPDWIINHLQSIHRNFPDYKLGIDFESEKQKLVLTGYAQLGQMRSDSKVHPRELGLMKVHFGDFKGVPQGSPTSPFLSILSLKDFLTQETSVSYADDPIFFKDTEFEIHDDPKGGIELNHSKSSWVKRDGIWLKPLKFLGIEYDGITLRSHTRSGATLEVTGNKKEILDAISKWEEEYKDGSLSSKSISKERVLDSWKRIFSRRLSGFLLSAMYNDSWNLNVEQDFTLKFYDNSWLDIQSKKRELPKYWNIFNVSSYATNSLLRTLTSRKGIPYDKLSPLHVSKATWPRGRPPSKR